MTHKIFLAMPLLLGACAWNPFQPSPGGVSFAMSQDGMVKYENTGRDIDGASGEVVFPNGARGKFRVNGSRGSASSDQAVAAQAQLNALLIAAMAEKLPSLASALRAGTLPIPPPAP